MTVLAGDVPRQKSDSTQLAVRIPAPWLARLDALIPWIAKPGVAATRTDAIRAALSRGLDDLEAEREREANWVDPLPAVTAAFKESPPALRELRRIVQTLSEGGAIQVGNLKHRAVLETLGCIEVGPRGAVSATTRGRFIAIRAERV